MALFSCPGCGKTISDKAEFCPACGALIRGSNSERSSTLNLEGKSKGKSKFIIIGLLLITVVIGIGAAVMAYPKYKVKNDIYVKAEKYLKSNKYGKAEAELLKIKGFKNTDELLENLNDKRDNYISKEAKEQQIEIAQLNSLTATAAVQPANNAIAEAVTVPVNYRDQDEIDVAEFRNELAKSIDVLDEAIISLKTLGGSYEYSDVENEGVRILENIREYFRESLEKFKGKKKISNEKFMDDFYYPFSPVVNDGTQAWLNKTSGKGNE